MDLPIWLTVLIQCVFIAFFQGVGIALQVLQNVVAIDKRNPEWSRAQVWAEFKEQDYWTLWISGVIAVAHVVAHLALLIYGGEGLPDLFHNMLFSLGIALVMGWGGQRIIYRFLGKAEETLNRKADNLK